MFGVNDDYYGFAIAFSTFKNTEVIACDCRLFIVFSLSS